MRNQPTELVLVCDRCGSDLLRTVIADDGGHCSAVVAVPLCAECVKEVLDTKRKADQC